MKSGTTLKRVRCNKCFILKVRRRGFCGTIGKFVHFDETRRRWKDKTCPLCRPNSAGFSRIGSGHVRTPAVERVGLDVPVYPAKLRNCRECGAKTHNYYRCVECHRNFLGGKSDCLSAEDSLGCRPLEFMQAFSHIPTGFGVKPRG